MRVVRTGRNRLTRNMSSEVGRPRGELYGRAEPAAPGVGHRKKWESMR